MNPLRFAVPLFTSAMVACASPDINVRSEWGTGLSEYGLLPVYPLRENVYIGDIYLVVNNPCENSITKLMQMVLVGSIPEDTIAAAFDTFYGDRPQLPATSAKASPPTTQSSKGTSTPAPGKVTINGITATGPGTATMTVAPGGNSPNSSPSTTPPGGSGAATGGSSVSNAAGAITPQPVASADDPIFEPKGKSRTFTRLRLASFPDFSLGSSYTIEGGGGGLIGGFNAAMGFGHRTTSHLSVSVSGVEESVIPAPVLMKAIRAFLTSPSLPNVIDLYTIVYLQNSLESQMEQEPGCRNPIPKKSYLTFVNRVFYARTVTFDFGQNEVTAALLKATAASAGQAVALAGNNTSGTSSSTSGSSAASSGTGSSTTTTAVDPNEAAVAAMQKEVAALVGSGAPGGSLSLGISTSGSVAMKQTFDRPMAFGVDHSITFPLEQIAHAMSLMKTRTASGI
jgi:hypothetical protein